MIETIQRILLYIFSLGCVISMLMGIIVLIYYSARQDESTLYLCARIFIACSIFFGLLLALIIISHICEKYKNKRRITVQINNEPQIINYQDSRFNYFSIDDDEEEIIINNITANKVSNKKINIIDKSDNISTGSADSHLIITPF